MFLQKHKNPPIRRAGTKTQKHLREFVFNNSDRYNKGFTLIETLIYTAIIGLIVGAFIHFSISLISARNTTYSAQEVQVNLRTSFNFLTEKIKSAESINFVSSTLESDPGVLVLIMSSSTLNPTTIELDSDDGILQITQGVGSPISITSDEVRVTDLVFSNLTGTSLRENIGIEMTIEYLDSATQDFTYSQNMQTAVSLRR